MRGRRRFGLGLRAQILAILFVVFAAALPLLSVAAFELTDRARATDRLRDATPTAEVFAAMLGDAETSRREFEDLAATVVGTAGIIGARWSRTDGAVWEYGDVGEGTPVRAETPSGSQIELRVQPSGPGLGTPLAGLLLLYVGVTGLAVLILLYIVMTYLIVRPVERLTLASERLARRGEVVQVPERGGAEIARLAVAFNEMAAQLRSERVALEARLAELEQTTTELRRAQDQVLQSAKLASVGQLAAGVAHEIGNPLAAIAGLIELLRGGEFDESEQQEFLLRMHSETDRIQKIIRELLDFARPDDDADLERGSDLVAVVEDAIRLLEPQKLLRQVTLRRDLPDGLPSVRGSADRLTQVVFNLLFNAADAVAGAGEISIQVARHDGGLLLVVADTGPGIDPAVSDRLFDPFVTTKPPGEGTGLGLAVCHTIVERVGGWMAAKNQPTGGARFEVWLPTADSVRRDL